MKSVWLLAVLLALPLPSNAHPAPPNLSAAELAALDKEARRALSLIQQRSMRERREFCGYIRRIGRNFVAEKPARGTEYGCDLRWEHGDEVPLATYHTHSSYSHSADSEVPSVLDLRGDIEDGLIGYISTPGGRFWRTNTPAGMAVQLCGTGCLYDDPNFRDIPQYGPVFKQFELHELMQRQAE